MKDINIQEGLDAINRIKLLMEYSLDKTLSENVLTLNEQAETELNVDGPIIKFNNQIVNSINDVKLLKKGDKVNISYIIYNTTTQPIIFQNMKGLGDFEYKGGTNLTYPKQPILPKKMGNISFDIVAKYSGPIGISTFSTQLQFLSNGKSQIINLPQLTINITQPDIHELTDHEFNELMQIGVVLIPGGGIIAAITAGAIGMLDAYNYYKEGDKSKAAISALFSILPASKTLRSIFSPVSKVANTLKSTLINKGSKAIINKEEKKFVELIINYRELIISEAKKLAKSAAKGGKEVAKEIEPYFTTQTGYDIYKSKTEDYDRFIKQLIFDNPNISDIQNLKVVNVDNNGIPIKVKIKNQVYSIQYEDTSDKYIYKLNKI